MTTNNDGGYSASAKSAVRLLLSLGAFASVGVTDSSAGILDWLLPRHDLQVVTVTDMTPEGAKFPKPSIEAPAYYFALTTGLTDFGAPIAGQEKPPKQLIYNTIAKVLAKQGLRPATDKTPAPQYLVSFNWGTLNPEMDNFSSGDSSDPAIQRNQSKVLNFIGAYKNGAISRASDLFLPAGWSVRSADEQKLLDLSQENLFVFTISAFDFEAAKRKEKKLLWVTRVSCPSMGFSMTEAIPAMIIVAGPNIGRDTPRPVFFEASDKFKGHVDLGDPVVIQYLKSGDNLEAKQPPSPPENSAFRPNGVKP